MRSFFPGDRGDGVTYPGESEMENRVNYSGDRGDGGVAYPGDEEMEE